MSDNMWDEARVLLTRFSRGNEAKRNIIVLLNKAFNGDWQAAVGFILKEPNEQTSYFHQLQQEQYEYLITALTEMIRQRDEAREAETQQQREAASQAYRTSTDDDPIER